MDFNIKGEAVIICVSCVFLQESSYQLLNRFSMMPPDSCHTCFLACNVTCVFSIRRSWQILYFASVFHHLPKIYLFVEMLDLGTFLRPKYSNQIGFFDQNVVSFLNKFRPFLSQSFSPHVPYMYI